MNGGNNTVIDMAPFWAKRDATHSSGLPDEEPVTQPPARMPTTPSPLSLRMRAWEDGTRLFPAVVALGAVLFGVTIPHAIEVAMPAAASIGALFVLNKRAKLAFVGMVLGGNLAVNGNARMFMECWFLLGLTLAALACPRRLVTTLLASSRWIWVMALAVAIVCCAAVYLIPPPGPTIFAVLGMPVAAYLGCGLARHLAMGDARLLSWGKDGLVPVTRDLLLGRITSGMLHDLAQPLNVISMANGNLGYIVDQLDIDPLWKSDITNRVSRIATHAESAAYILGLFRGFGRDGNRELSSLHVRGALERAVAATKSSVRHHGVSVELAGDGLEHPVPTQHGALEMMAVAALLNGFAAYIGNDGERSKGLVRLTARLSPAYLTVSVQCLGEDGAPVGGRMPDHATLWLVEQVAISASADFRCYQRKSAATRFLIRLGRDDI